MIRNWIARILLALILAGAVAGCAAVDLAKSCMARSIGCQ